MTGSPQSPKRRSTFSDDELGGLIRNVADRWSPPSERSARRPWERRADRGRGAIPGRVVAGLGVAVIAALLVVLSAPYLGLLRQLGVGPSSSPSGIGASPSAAATPLPKLATYGDPLPPTRLVVGDYQYQILDLSTGTMSGSIGPGAGCDSVARTDDGSIACAVVGHAGAQGTVLVRLAMVDTAGRTTGAVTLAEYAPDAYPQVPNTVVARTMFDPARALIYVSHVTRHLDSWSISIDLFRVPSGSPAGTLEVARIPATGGLIDNPDNGPGEMLDPELLAPQLQIAPGGRHLVARSALVQNQGAASALFWRISLDAEGRMSDPLSWPSGATDGSLDDCLGDSGFASPSAYYLACGPGVGTSVRRVDLAGVLLGDTSLPSEVRTYPLVSALDAHGGALLLWSGVTRSIVRVDLATGALIGPVTAQVASSAGALGALAAVAGGLADWIAPPAAGKIFLQPGMVVSSDGSRVYALGLARGEPGPFESTGIYVFDGATLAQLAHWLPTADFISLALSADGTLLYAAGTSGERSGPAIQTQSSVTVFESVTGKIRVIAGQLGATAIFFSPGGLLEIGG